MKAKETLQLEKLDARRKNFRMQLLKFCLKTKLTLRYRQSLISEMSRLNLLKFFPLYNTEPEYLTSRLPLPLKS